MQINQPHLGGLELLHLVFGTTAKTTVTGVYFYAAPVETEVVFSDTDTRNQPVGLIDLNDYMASISAISATTFTNAALDGLIATLSGVPTIEIPAITVTFSAALSTGYSLYGFAVCTDATVDNNVIYRETFETPIVPGNGVSFTIYPTIRIGNTISQLS